MPSRNGKEAGSRRRLEMSWLGISWGLNFLTVRRGEWSCTIRSPQTISLSLSLSLAIILNKRRGKYHGLSDVRKVTVCPIARGKSVVGWNPRIILFGSSSRYFKNFHCSMNISFIIRGPIKYIKYLLVSFPSLQSTVWFSGYFSNAWLVTYLPEVFTSGLALELERAGMCVLLVVSMYGRVNIS